ncbi:MAG: beta-lactamase family protein [Chloroflexi bacterium]|nr:beta-lactamase family protein [Chloroflexota bacterium]MCC6893115.1 beta-lactamase family protein [Anaerolineae bacterium]
MLDSYIQQFITDHHIPGLALAIQRGDTVIHEGYYGLANLEHQVAVTTDSVFEIASVSKLFTAQAVLRLAQEGQLALADTVAGYVEGLPEAWHTVTIQHCLTHQSGIPNYTAQDRYWALQRVSKSPAEVLDLVRDLPMNFPPGQRHSYDNTGYYLLGMVIESVTKQPYADYLRDLIFTPLGMTATRGNDYDAIVPHRAQGYSYVEGQLINKHFYDISNTFSAGVLLSTVRDLLTWRKSWFDSSILNADYRKRWWTPHLSAEANEKAYHYTVGLGWFMVESTLGTFLGHNGGIQGFSASLLYLPETQTMGVALYNRNDVDNPHQLLLDLITKLQAD